MAPPDTHPGKAVLTATVGDDAHPGSPLWGRPTVFPVGLCRTLGRSSANSFSVPHRPVLSPCNFFFGSHVVRLFSLLPWRWGDRLLTSQVRRLLRRLLRLLRGWGDCTSGFPPHTVEDFVAANACEGDQGPLEERAFARVRTWCVVLSDEPGIEHLRRETHALI